MKPLSDENLYGYSIVSKDSDFHERSLVKGFPPKIVWITRGNCGTEQIAGLLRANAVRTTELHADHEARHLRLRSGSDNRVRICASLGLR